MFKVVSQEYDSSVPKVFFREQTWNIEDEGGFPNNFLVNILNAVYVEATEKELDLIRTLFSAGIPFLLNKHSPGIYPVQRWYGDYAKQIIYGLHTLENTDK